MRTAGTRALLVLVSVVLLAALCPAGKLSSGVAGRAGRAIPQVPAIFLARANLSLSADPRPTAVQAPLEPRVDDDSGPPASPSKPSGGRSPVGLETRTVSAGTHRIAVTLVRVRLRDPGVTVKVALGRDRVGGTEDLLALAERKDALAAINGGFFDAYVEDEIKDPIGTIITGGEMVHKGDVGTVFGITLAMEVRMEPVRFKIAGATNGSYDPPNGWCAYWINHAPSTTTRDHAAVYTPARGDTTGPVGGTSVVVRDGRVVQIGSGTQIIPKDGYVVNLQGSELALASLFRIGTPVEYRVALQDGSPLGGFWAEVEEGLAAGPKLVADGEVVHSTHSAKAEGFTDPRILYASAARSALGMNAKGELLLVTTASATMAELAQVMHSLGSVEAMNLDGGGSSGLVYRGKYVTQRGRRVSNALLVIASS